jgi:hypothetical protein
MPRSRRSSTASSSGSPCGSPTSTEGTRPRPRRRRHRCAHTFGSGLTVPPQPIRDNLERAIAEGRAEDAWAWALALRQVGLDQAPALTVLLGRSGDRRHLRAFHRFLVRLIEEAEPSLLSLRKLVDALDVVGRVR